MDEKFPRLSEKEWLVLQQLAVHEKYGLEIVQDSDGTISRNSVYVLLGRMEDKGFITGREEAPAPGEQGPPRRKYKITGVGAKVARARALGEAVLRGEMA